MSAVKLGVGAERWAIARYFLLVLVIAFVGTVLPPAAQPALSQVTECTGSNTPTSDSYVNFDLSAGTCTIGDGSGFSLAAGDFGVKTRPQLSGDFDRIFGDRNDSGYTLVLPFCDIDGSGNLNPAICEVDKEFTDGIKSVVVENAARRMEVEVTVSGGGTSFSITSARVCVGSGSAACVTEGTITIVKETAPEIAGDGTFAFSSPDDGELDALSLTTVGNVATSAVFTKASGSYRLSEDMVEGWVLSDISCDDPDGETTYDLGSREVTIDLDGGEDITCTFTNRRDEDYVRERTKRVIKNFLSRRVDQLAANEPDLVERLTRRGTAGGGARPFGYQASGTLSNYRLGFSTSLSRILSAEKPTAEAWPERVAAVAMMLGQQAQGGGKISLRQPTALPGKTGPEAKRVGAPTSALAYDGEEGGPPAAPRPGFDVWIEGTWAHVEDDTRKSDLGLLYVGADYLVNPNFVVGILAQFDWMDEKDASEDIAADGKGWMAGPYVVARLHQNLLLDGRVAWGQSANHVDPLGLYTDSFDTDRWLARAQLTGDFRSGDWLFAPFVRVIYVEEDQKAYTDSLGIMIPSQTVSLGRVAFGPKVSYLRQSENGAAIEPYIELRGVWDFDKAEIVDLATGLPVGSSGDFRARVEGGVSLRGLNGMSLTGSAFYDGIGVSGFSAYGGRIMATVPLN